MTFPDPHEAFITHTARILTGLGKLVRAQTEMNSLVVGIAQAQTAIGGVIDQTLVDEVCRRALLAQNAVEAVSEAACDLVHDYAQLETEASQRRMGDGR
jgi:hypothetical protein